LIVANVTKKTRKAIEALAAEHGLLVPASGLRRNAIACVALPTCGLALAESERYLPDLVTRWTGACRRMGLARTTSSSA